MTLLMRHLMTLRLEYPNNTAAETSDANNETLLHDIYANPQPGTSQGKSDFQKKALKRFHHYQ